MSRRACHGHASVVVIENIVRHLDKGLSPMETALKGASEIGFTIVSITLSLIAVFIPLFMMGGYTSGSRRRFGTASCSLVGGTGVKRVSRP